MAASRTRLTQHDAPLSRGHSVRYPAGVGIHANRKGRGPERRVKAAQAVGTAACVARRIANDFSASTEFAT